MSCDCLSKLGNALDPTLTAFATGGLIKGLHYPTIRAIYDAVRVAERHAHNDECWEPNSGCDMGRNSNHVRKSGFGPADIRNLADALPFTVSPHIREVLRVLADVVEAAYIEEDAGPMYAALAKLEAIKP